MTVTNDEIFAKVQEALVDALGVDDDEVTDDAKLVEDLGAESIDFLDIVFRLEKSFDIKIPRNELFPEDILQVPENVEDGNVTAAGMAKRAMTTSWMPRTTKEISQLPSRIETSAAATPSSSARSYGSAIAARGSRTRAVSANGKC